MKELIGQRLSKYEIESQIGRGGMATVFRAKDPALNRYVAVKVLPPEYVEQMPDFAERFRREAQAIAQLEHPHILPVYDYGQQGPYTYLVMRYIEGSRTLSEAMRASLTLDESLNYLRQIGNALDYAHERGIIHRDIKPGNILLDGNWAFLADFGLARMVEATVQLTRTGTGMGTPAYMSPEQGIGEKVDHRTDLYAVGVIAYQMFTGEIPHSAPTPHAIIYKRNHEPPLSIREHNPELSPVMDDCIQKALATAPDARFDSTGEFVTSLEQATRQKYDGSTIEARRDTNIGSSISSVVGEYWLHILAGIGGVIILLIGLLGLFLANSDNSQEAIASVNEVEENNTVAKMDAEGTPPTSTPTSTSTSTTTPVKTDNLKTMYQSAKSHMDDGDLDKALFLLQQIALEDPDYADVALLIRELSVTPTPSATSTPTRESATATPTSTPTTSPPEPIFPVKRNIPFEDGFGGEINSEYWNIIQGDGQVQVNSGELLLSSNGQNFPLIYPKGNPFPKSGNLRINLEIRYPTVTERGVGFRLGDSLARYGSNQDIDRDELYQGRIIEIWQDVNSWHISVGDNDQRVFSLPAPNKDDHEIEINYINRVYQILVDGGEVYRTEPIDRSPNIIWFGNPAQVDSNGMWSSLAINSISIELLSD